LLATPLLLVEDAKPFDAEGAERDMAFAVLKGGKRPAPLKLSNAASAVGDRVWLFARLADRDRPSAYGASVTDVSAGTVQYRFDDSSLNLRSLSGAPVIGADGTVVGMHLGYGSKDDKLVGAAAPASAIHERLTAAAAGLDKE
jgi:hypothetical protein